MIKKVMLFGLSLLMIALVACGSNGVINDELSNELKAQLQNANPILEYAGNTLIDSMDTITFGVDEDGDPMEWIVIEKDRNRALLLSKYIVHADGYKEEQENVTWETCAMRKWLDTEFINKVFNKREQSQIVQTNLKNENNPEYGTSGGKDTKDRVFLLSVSETEKYLTGKAKAKYKNGDRGWYPLRTMGVDNAHVSWVNFEGDIEKYGGELSGGLIWGGGIRPALTIKY